MSCRAKHDAAHVGVGSGSAGFGRPLPLARGDHEALRLLQFAPPRLAPEAEQQLDLRKLQDVSSARRADQKRGKLVSSDLDNVLYRISITAFQH